MKHSSFKFKKLVLTILTIVAFICSCLFLFTACTNTPPSNNPPSSSIPSEDENFGENSGENSGSGESSGSGENSNPSEGADSESKEDNDQEITTVYFHDNSFVYDGTAKSLAVFGTLPQGVSVSYTNNNKINVGSYSVNATLSGKGYKTKTLSATLTITNATITGASLSDDTVEYDTKIHSLQVKGLLPAGASVVITYNGKLVGGVSEVGSHKVTATISCANYNTLTLTATLNIISSEERLYSVNANGSIYFQNALDSNSLYVYKNNALKKANRDVANGLTFYNGSIYYTSNALLGSSIKTYDGTSTTKLCSAKADYLVVENNYVYYSVNGLLLKSEDKGIWRLSLTDKDAVPTRLTQTKGEYLVYNSGKIYFSNKDDGGKLYSIPVTANNGTPTLLFNEKVTDIITDSSALYFNSGSIGKAIRKYNLANDTCIKLTTDSGKYLTIIDDYVYYIRNDVLTTTLFGDNICKISTKITSDNSLPGISVLLADKNGFSSLTSDGANLYYYKLSDKHFYTYNISSNSETDLMKGFQPVDNTTIQGFAKITEYNGDLYYINLLDNNTLYRYSPASKAVVKVLDDTVSGVYFNGNYMYYSTYILTNFALWKMDLSTGEKAVKITSDRCDHLIFDGDTIYYIKTGSMYNNYIYSMDLDGNNVKKLFNTTLYVSDFYKEGNYLYCMANTMTSNDKIYKFDLSSATGTAYDFESEAFTIHNGKIYYYEQNNNKLYCYNGSTSVLLASNVKINDLIVSGNYLYFSSVSNTKKGLYRLDLTTNDCTAISTMPADGLFDDNGTIYFMSRSVLYTNDYPGTENNGGDGHLYKINGNTITKCA